MTIMEALGGHPGDTIMENLGGHIGDTIADVAKEIEITPTNSETPDSEPEPVEG